MGKTKILVIDDEKDFLDLMKKALEPAGYEVIIANDGDEGVTKAKACKPDLVICDIKMPKKDGFQVLKEMRQNDEFRRTPFIMLTVVDDFKKVEEAYDDEADFYVTKPVKFDKLLKNIPLLLNLQKSKKE
jgi:two-component system alkaline phosphatase synthesis response regulator PhoP